MAKSKNTESTESVEAPKSAGTSELAQALIQAIELTRPEQKKNAFNRKVGTPWTPTDGTKKPKLKRKIFQHGLPASEETLSPGEIDLMNQIKPGIYLNGTVKINRRKDRGLDISYHIKTASQRLKLVNQFGVRTLEELLARCIEEAANPVKFAVPDTD